MAVDYLATMEKLRGEITRLMNEYSFAKNLLVSGKWQDPLGERDLTSVELQTLGDKAKAIEGIVSGACQYFQLPMVEKL